MPKLLISNQHGAWVMALLPFLYAMSLAPFQWQSVFLLAGWIALYLATYPFLNLFKGRNLPLYTRWTVIYLTACVLLLLPALVVNWQILYVALAILPFVLVNIYYTKQKNERALCNDLAAIVIFAIVGMGAYYFTARRIDHAFWLVGLYPSLFFIGTTLYVKSVLRERKNPRYLYASIIYHAAIVSFFAMGQQWLLSLAFLPSLVRAIIVPRYRLSVKQVGLLEFAISAWFFIFLLWGTWPLR